MKRPRKRKQPPDEAYAYYIRRESALDDSLYFCDPDGKRVFFERAVWIEALLPAFGPDQHATCVRMEKAPDDVSFQEWVSHMLPDGVSVDAYLADLKQLVKDRRKNRRTKHARVAALAAQFGGR